MSFGGFRISLSVNFRPIQLRSSIFTHTFLMSQQRFLSLLSFLFFTTCAFGQYEYFRPTVVTTDYTNQLAGTFRKATVTSLNSKAIKQYVQGKTTANISLVIGNRIVNVSLTPHSVMSPNMKIVTVGKNNVREEIVDNENVNYVGYTQDSFQAVMTIDEGYISGYFYKGKEAFFIEPLMVFVHGAPADLFVAYKREDIIPREVLCPVEDDKKKVEENVTNTMMLRLPTLGTHANASTNTNFIQTVTPPTMALSEASTGNGCTKVNLAIVTPYDMFAYYGSVNAIRDRIASIIAATNTDYDDDFNKVIEFTIKTFVITTSPQSKIDSLIGDTATTTGNTVSALSNFKNQGGYGSATFDVMQLFLRRRFRSPQNSTLGVAGLGQLCTQGGAYNIQIDGNSLDVQRIIFSHELGHNFGCEHTGGGIMSPFVAYGSLEWHPLSVLAINNKEASAHCNLSLYSLAGTAVPNFEIVSTYCVDQIVRLKSDSAKNPTSFAWSIPNGSTTSGNARSIQTSFSAPGDYLVTHTVGNNVACANGDMSAAFSKTKKLRVINFRNKTYPSNFTSAYTVSAAGTSFGFGIMNVTLLDINNSTGDNSPTTGNDAAVYLDFTCRKFTRIPAGTTSATISVSTGVQNESGNAWIDWNNDGIFDNATERILSSSAGSNKTHTATFTIPSTAVKNQMLTLRVVDKLSSLAANAISNTAIGQVEDYGVILSDNCAGVVPTITASASTTFCEGDSVTLTSSAAMGNVWSTGETTQSITVNTSGTYFVSVTNASACTAISSTTTVTVHPQTRKPSISADMPLVVCPSGSVKLYSSSSTSYLWSNGGTSQTTNITASGKYAVTTTDGNGCQATSDSVTITTGANVTPSVSIFASSTTISTGTNVTFTAMPTNGGTTPSYQWKLNNVNVGTNSSTYRILCKTYCKEIK